MKKEKKQIVVRPTRSKNQRCNCNNTENHDQTTSGRWSLTAPVGSSPPTIFIFNRLQIASETLPNNSRRPVVTTALKKLLQRPSSPPPTSVTDILFSMSTPTGAAHSRLLPSSPINLELTTSSGRPTASSEHTVDNRN